MVVKTSGRGYLLPTNCIYEHREKDKIYVHNIYAHNMKPE